MSEEKWSYFTTAISKYDVSKTVLEKLIVEDKVQSKETYNRRYHTTCRLILTSDLEKNGIEERIKKKRKKKSHYEKLDKEGKEKFHQTQNINCPICNKKCVTKKSEMIKTYTEQDDDDFDSVTFDDVKKAIIIAHIRHNHTDYEKRLSKKDFFEHDDLRSFYTKKAYEILEKNMQMKMERTA